MSEIKESRFIGCGAVLIVALLMALVGLSIYLAGHYFTRTPAPDVTHSAAATGACWGCNP